MVEESMAILPVVQMQDQRVATFDILLIDLHHQHVVGDLIDESTIVVQLHYPVRLAQRSSRILAKRNRKKDLYSSACTGHSATATQKASIVALVKVSSNKRGD